MKKLSNFQSLITNIFIAIVMFCLIIGIGIYVVKEVKHQQETTCKYCEEHVNESMDPDGIECKICDPTYSMLATIWTVNKNRDAKQLESVKSVRG